MSEEIKDLVLFQNIVILLSLGSGILVFLFFLFSKQSKQLKPLKRLILTFVLVGVSIDLLMNLIYKFNLSLNDYYESFFNMYSFSVAFLLIFLFRKINVTVFFNNVSTISFGLFILALISFAVYKRNFSFENSIFQIILAFLILFFVLYYFFWKFNFVGTVSITKEYTFWFFTALFIYFGMPLVLTITQNYLGSVQPIALGYLWQIMNLSTVLFHLLIAKTLWLMKTE